MKRTKLKVLALVAGASVACNGLLGVTDGSFVPGTDAGTPADVDATTSDADPGLGPDSDAAVGAPADGGATDSGDADARTGNLDGNAVDAAWCNPSSCPTGCTQGECIVTLASAIVWPTSIAVSGGSVYFTGYGALGAVPSDGGTLGWLDAGTADNVVADSTSATLCWSSGTSVNCMPRAGGAVSTLSSWAYVPYETIPAPVVFGGTVYWAASIKPAPYGVWSSPENTPDGGAAFAINDAGTSFALAVNPAEIYFIAGTTLFRDKLGGGALAAVPQANRPYCLAADSENIYWADMNGVKKVAVSGASSAASETLALFGVDPGGCFLLADTSQTPTMLYMGNLADKTIRKISSAGGGSTVLASGQNPTGIAVDGTSVYWTNYTFGGVARIITDAGTVMKVTPK